MTEQEMADYLNRDDVKAELARRREKEIAWLRCMGVTDDEIARLYKPDGSIDYAATIEIRRGAGRQGGVMTKSNAACPDCVEALLHDCPCPENQSGRHICGKKDVLEAVDHPVHYKRGGIEAIDVIDAWSLGFCLGNVVKYISRAGHKGDMLEDLRKARWYLDHEIARLDK